MPDPVPVPGDSAPGSSPGEPGGQLAAPAAYQPLSWNLTRHARRLLTLALAGLGIAIVTGRPEFAGAAAPPVLLLATWHRRRPAQVGLAAG
jgi:hypothetical protein